MNCPTFLDKAASRQKIDDVLYEIEGVSQVNLVMQSEEVSR